MADPVKLGIIGCGVIGRVHARHAAESDLVDLIALADLREDAVKEAAEEFGVDRTYASGEALLADGDVEAVILAMPTCHRTPLALAAFEQGKHVLTEKPVAMNADEVAQMMAARGDLTVACCSSRYMFPESAVAAREFIRTGALGDIRVVHCRCVKPAGPDPKSERPPWRLNRSLNGGGIFVNWGCYDLNYLLGLLDWSLEPTGALADTWQIAPQLGYYAAAGSDAETHVKALVRCKGDAVLSYERAEGSTCAPEDSWRIIGSKGSLRLHMTGGPKEIVYDTVSPEEGLVSKVIWQGEDDKRLVHAGPIEDFARAIREKREPETNLERSLVLQKITDAVYASADSGAAVSFD